MFNAITKFTGLWFPHKERIIATTFILIANYLGNLSTNWYLAWIPYDENAPFDEIYKNFRYYFEAYWLAMAVFSFIILIVFILAFRAAPNHIPSKS